MILHAALTAIALAAPGGAPQASGAAQVSGMVLDSAGLPLADVCIGSMHSDDGKFDVFDAPFPDQTNCTGEDGAFTLRVAPGNVAVVAALYRDQITLRLTPVKVAASRTTVTVRFDASSSIRVRALDPAGRPLRGVRVTALPERTRPDAARGDATVVRGWTGDDGTAVLAGLAPGEHRIIAYGAAHRCVEACEFGQGLRARTGDSLVNVPMAPLGAIRGKVLLRDPEGALKPVSTFLLRSLALGTFWYTTDAGRFLIEVPRLWAGAPLLVTVPGAAPFATRFDVKEPATVDLGEIVLGPGRAVRGRVTNADGEPVEGAEVRVGFKNYSLPEPLATTGTGGAFQIEGISRDATTLTVTHPMFRPQEVAVAAGARELEVRLTAAVALTVRVVDADGRALTGARVQDMLTFATCHTGADGTCTFTGLERKEQVLEAGLKGAPLPEAWQLRVPAARLPGTVTFRLPRRPSALRIIGTEADGRFAQAMVHVVPGEVAPQSALDDRGALAVPYHATGIDLEKVIPNLPPGRYTVYVRSFSDPRRCAIEVVDLPEGADQRVIVKLPAERGPCRM